MKRHRHTPEQVVRKLREGERLLNEGVDLTGVLRTLEISEATWNISELGQDSGREDDTEPWLAGLDLSLAVTAKMAGHPPRPALRSRPGFDNDLGLELGVVLDASVQRADQPHLPGHDRRERRLNLRRVNTCWHSRSSGAATSLSTSRYRERWPPSCRSSTDPLVGCGLLRICRAASSSSYERPV